MSEMNEETGTVIDEYTVLQKFEGEPKPENLIERIHIDNGEIVKREVYENGELVSSEDVVGEVE
jgi:hypothetical protein